MERMTQATDGSVRNYHEARYYFAQRYAKGRHVLDVACGDGSGSTILAKAAASVTSVDPERTIDHAVPKFISKYAEELTFKEEFDLIVSFETIEHVISPRVFLEKLWLALRTKGVLIMSFPNDWGETAFHLHNTSPATLQLVREYFAIVELLGQNRRVQPDPKSISRTEFWVENVVLVAEKRESASIRGRPIEEIYYEVTRKQHALSNSLSWKIKQALPRLRTFLKRRGLCRTP
jgi:SAM-dependent methyltransferase